MTIDELLAKAKADADAAGLSVSCPACDTGAGKFCRDANGKAIVHVTRVRKAAKLAGAERAAG